MPKYLVHAYCFNHAGTIEKPAKTKKEGLALYAELKKTARHMLNVPKNQSAKVVFRNCNKGRDGVIKSEMV